MDIRVDARGLIGSMDGTSDTYAGCVGSQIKVDRLDCDVVISRRKLAEVVRPRHGYRECRTGVRFDGMSDGIVATSCFVSVPSTY